MMQPTPNETQIHTDELVDIREVSVDKNLPKHRCTRGTNEIK